MLNLVKRSCKGVYTANIKFLDERFGGRLTDNYLKGLIFNRINARIPDRTAITIKIMKRKNDFSK